MITRHLIIMLLLIVPSVRLVGCNAIYFAETDKASLTIEARPDASSPLAANIGVKQRVVAVVPPRKTSGDSDPASHHPKDGISAMDRAPAGDAMSLLSYFNFEKTKNGPSIGEPVTIELALLTGAAATNVQQAGAEATGDVMRSFIPSPRFVTAEQGVMQTLVDQALVRPDDQQAIIFTTASTIIGDNFAVDYQQRINSGLPPHIAFVATKNLYLGEELTRGRGPKYDRLIEALQLALHAQGAQ
jgi:hypothetical protein